MSFNGNLREGLTFDDVLLVPQKSSIIPSDVCLKSLFQHFFYHIIITIWFQEEKNLRYIDKICVRFQIFSDRVLKWDNRIFGDDRTWRL